MKWIIVHSVMDGAMQNGKKKVMRIKFWSQSTTEKLNHFAIVNSYCQFSQLQFRQLYCQLSLIFSFI